MTDPILQIDALDKRYGDVHALRALTVEIGAGAFGLLGPNGAGKSTLIKLLLGLLEPDAGRARIVGLDPARRPDRLAIRRVVGYMPEGDCLIPGMNAVDLVTTLGRVTGMRRHDAMMRAHEVLDYVGLDEARYRGLDEYSTGMKQRLKLAQALVHDPELLLLDEPTNGLDPAGRREMLRLVRDLAVEQHKNVLLCSHLLPDVEQTCDAVIVIDRGRVLQTGTIAGMTETDGRWLKVVVEGAVESFETALTEAGFQCESQGAGSFRVLAADDQVEDSGDRIFAVAAQCGAVLVGLSAPRSSLEDAFLGALKEAEGA